MELMERIRKWFASLKPAVFMEMMEKEKESANLGDAITNIVLSMLPLTTLLAILLVFLLFSNTQTLSSIGAGIVLVLVVILLPVAYLLRQGVYWVSGKLFGGTGSFVQQCYFLSFPEASFGLFDSTIGLVLMLIPCVGNLVSLVISMYGLYLQYLAFKSIHRLSTARAIGAALAPSVLVIIILVILTFYLASTGMLDTLQKPLLQ